MSENNKPAAKVSVYPVHATIWRNGNFYSVTFERSYKDKDGSWKRTNSFSGHELLWLAKCADMAHTETLRLRALDTRETNEEVAGDDE
jgi:hypothetical protein